MLRRVAVLVAFSLVISVNSYARFSQSQDFRPATPEEKALKDVAYAAGASAVILDWVELDNDQKSYSAEYYRIKILTEDGKKYADVEVPYNAGYPFKEHISDISARTIQPDGTIVPFNGKVYDKVLYKASGARVRAKELSLAGVQVGSILEYRYQRRWAELTLVATQWVIQRDIPMLRARMSLLPFDSKGEFGSFFTYHNLPTGKMPAKNPIGTYDLEMTDVPPFQKEELAPPEDSLKARVNFYYTTSRVDPTKFWSAQAAGWSKSIENFIGKPEDLRERALALAGKEPMETLKNVYAKVQSFRNLSFEEDVTADEKKTATEVVRAGEGYRGEINRAFVALARAAGLDAAVVRVAPRDRDFFAPNIPDAGQMDGEIAAVTIEGQTLYLDPGTPTAPLGIVSWEKSEVPGYRIAGRTSPQLQNQALQKPEDAVIHRSAELRLNGDVLEGSIVATFTGQEALRRRLRVWGEDEATRMKDLEDEAKGWFPAGTTVKMTELTGSTTHAEPLVAKLDVTIPNLVSAAGSRTVLPISVFAASAKNPFASATRVHPIYFPFRRREHDEVRVTIPDTLLLVAVPLPAKLDAGTVSYTNEVRQDGNVIVFKRDMILDTILVEAQYYRPLRAFYSAMNTADQKPLVLIPK